MIVLAALLLASALAPGAQMLGPQWLGQRVDVRGQVIAMVDDPVHGACRQLAVERDGISGADGRLWACYPDNDTAPFINDQVRVRGVVSDTRMTRMGPYLRVVPLVQIHPTSRSHT